jgi:predicted RNA-binding protein with EMAP domain
MPKKGWRRESARHALASKGVRTKAISRVSRTKIPKYVKGNPFSYIAEDPKENAAATEYTLKKISQDWDKIVKLVGKSKDYEAEYGDDLWDYVEVLAEKVRDKHEDAASTDTAAREAIWTFIMKKAGKYRMWANERNKSIGEKIF